MLAAATSEIKLKSTGPASDSQNPLSISFTTPKKTIIIQNKDKKERKPTSYSYTNRCYYITNMKLLNWNNTYKIMINKINDLEKHRKLHYPLSILF